MGRAEHRRRMELEAKAKVVSSVWGEIFVQYLAALAVSPRSIWKNRMNLTFFFQIDQGKIASWARNGKNSAPQIDATTFALFLTLPSSMELSAVRTARSQTERSQGQP